MQRFGRACALLLLNAATGVAALCLLILSPLPGTARHRVLAAARGLASFQRRDADRATNAQVICWLAVHAVVGPGFLAGVVAALAAMGVIWTLRTYETSAAITLTMSLSLVAFVVVGALLTLLAAAVEERLSDLVLRADVPLAERIRELTASRAAAVDAQAAEVRRIERDLHDGAQARLIAMRINLGLARTSDDPDQVRELVEESWESAGHALNDLRDLVRGIHPPVLADRGLPGGLEAAALGCPVPVALDLELPVRPEPPVESALYFAAVEILANAAKHSGAARASIRLRYAGGMLRVTIGDDGRGGADPGAGSGLAGIRRRLSAFDGTLAVHSPEGGPTEITMEVPCALSSPKISPS